MYTYPHTIENKYGEKLIFQCLIKEPDGDKLETDGFAKPGAGPTVHVHWKQDESLTVISGKMAIQIPPGRNLYITDPVKQQHSFAAPGIGSGMRVMMNCI